MSKFNATAEFNRLKDSFGFHNVTIISNSSGGLNRDGSLREDLTATRVDVVIESRFYIRSFETIDVIMLEDDFPNFNLGDYVSYDGASWTPKRINAFPTDRYFRIRLTHSGVASGLLTWDNTTIFMDSTTIRFRDVIL